MKRINLKEDILYPSLTGLGLLALFIGLAIFLDKDKPDLVEFETKTEILYILETVELEPVVAPTVKESELTYLGEFRISHFCKCTKCCGKNDGITATGTIATVDRTIAVDKSVISLGTRVLINGQEYVAEDVGGKIKDQRIDIFVSDHLEALERGIYYTEVYIGGGI